MIDDTEIKLPRLVPERARARPEWDSFVGLVLIETLLRWRPRVMTIVEFLTSNIRRSREDLRKQITENVGPKERAVSTLAGGFMVIDGLRRRGIGGLLESVFGASLLYRGSSGFCWLYNAIDIDTAKEHIRLPTVRVQRTITIDHDPQTVYSIWRKFENLPRFLKHVESVSLLEGKRLRWVVQGPLGRRIAWNAEITDDAPGHRLAWRSEEGAPVKHVGSVAFFPLEGGRATEMKLSLQYQPTRGTLREAVSRLFGDDPRRQIREDLERFRRVIGDEIRTESRAWQQEGPRVS